MLPVQNNKRSYNPLPNEARSVLMATEKSI